MNNNTLRSLISAIKDNGHNVRILEGERKGPQAAGKKILDNSEEYDFVFRLDDDTVLKPNVLTELMSVIESDDTVGCCGPIYINNPNLPRSQQMINKDAMFNDEIKRITASVFWMDNGIIHVNSYLQTVIHDDPSPLYTQHLYSGFIYRRKAAIEVNAYNEPLSVVSHREETFLSYSIHRAGYKLFIVPSAEILHLHPMSGGIRETKGELVRKENWDHDEKLFLERMEQWLPKTPQIDEDRKVSVIVLTHGTDHKNLREMLEGFATYTTHPYELIVMNNDIRPESMDDIYKVAQEFNGRLRNFKLVAPEGKNYPVGEARNQAVKASNPDCKYICFIDDDARILGRYNQSTDWIDYLYNEFTKVKEAGAISPIYTYFEPLQCHCVSVAIMFTSKRVWNIVGGFDKVFGDKSMNTWGYEDVDWSYRCEGAGFKLLGVTVPDLPILHEDTTFKNKPDWQVEGLKKGLETLLAKYDIDRINTFNRRGYPLTLRQREIKGPKLNVGCYHMYLEDFINIDVQPVVNPDMVFDMRDIRKHFGPNSVGVIVASHVLEHVDMNDAEKLLKDFYEILMPGGEVIIEVPDCEDVDGKLLRGEIPMAAHHCWTHGMPNEPYQEHLAVFTEQNLGEMMAKVGFKNLYRQPNDFTSIHFDVIRIDGIKA